MHIRHYDQIIIKENRYCTIQYSVMLSNSFLVNVDSNSRRQVGNIPCLFFFLLQILRINKKKTHKDLTKDVIYAKVSKVFVFV